MQYCVFTGPVRKTLLSITHSLINIQKQMNCKYNNNTIVMYHASYIIHLYGFVKSFKN